MNELIEKPYLIFLFAIPITILIGFLAGNAMLDINVHETYYVISYLYLAILISILFGIIGIGYRILQKTDKKLSKWLIWIHIGLTFGGNLIVWILSKFYRPEIMEYEFNNNLTLIITVIICLVIFGQIIFPINIIYGIIKNNSKSNC